MFNARPGFDSAVHERFVQGNIRIADFTYLPTMPMSTTPRDICLADTTARHSDQVGGALPGACLSTTIVVQVLFMQQHGNLVDIVESTAEMTRLLHVGETMRSCAAVVPGSDWAHRHNRISG